MEALLIDAQSAAPVRRAFGEGRFYEVEAMCKTVLAQEPETPWAWHYLGKLPALDAEAAIDFLGTAFSLAPEDALILADLSRVYARSGQLQRAVETAGQAVALQPNLAASVIALAEAYSLAGQTEAAWPLWERAVGLAPSSFPAQLAYGAGLQKLGKAKDAVKHLKRACDLNPKSFDAFFSLGKCYAKLNRHDLALQSFIAAKEINPREAWIWLEGSRSYFQSSNLKTAITWIKTAIECNNDLGWAHRDYAEYRLNAGDINGALESIRRAQALGVQDGKSYEIQGKIFQRSGRIDAALKSYEEAIRLAPDNLDFLSNYASGLIEGAKSRAALFVFERLMGKLPIKSPLRILPLMNKAVLLRGLGRSTEALQLAEEAMELIVRHGANVKFLGKDNPLNLNYLYSHLFVHGLDPKLIYTRHRKWGIEESKRCPPIFRHTNKNRGLPKIRVGYLSSDFKMHSVAAFISPVFTFHDLNRFEVFVYSGSANRDSISDRLNSRVSRWREVASESCDAIAKQIYDDGIDVLIELSGHTKGNMLDVCLLKPAPIQVSYLGYPATTGLTTIDYRLTDGVTDPVGKTEHLHTEKLMRIPDCAWCYQPLVESVVAREVPPLHEAGYVTFVCFNNLAKINDFIIELWCRILRQVPLSKMAFKDRNFSDPHFSSEFKNRFAAHNVSADRLITFNYSPSVAEHLALYGQTDIALDCFPYNGTTTTCEALSCGLPVVSLVGETHVSRVGLSLLSATDLRDLAVASAAEYEAKAIELAGDIHRLNQLRVSLPGRVNQSSLGDGAGFTKKLENCYQQMLDKYNNELR